MLWLYSTNTSIILIIYFTSLEHVPFKWAALFTVETLLTSYIVLVTVVRNKHFGAFMSKYCWQTKCATQSKIQVSWLYREEIQRVSFFQPIICFIVCKSIEIRSKTLTFYVTSPWLQQPHYDTASRGRDVILCLMCAFFFLHLNSTQYSAHADSMDTRG